MSTRTVLVNGAGRGLRRTMAVRLARPVLATKAPRVAVCAVVAASMLLLSPAARADSPARDRELACSDGTVFTGEQVRHGSGRPPSVWRGVTPGGEPVAFVFHAVTLTAPDGTVDEAESWDNTAGVSLNHELTTCSFVIPVGPLTGYAADFVGYFVPASS